MAGKPQRGSLRKIYLVNTKNRATAQAFADLLGDLPDNIFPLHQSPLDLPIAVSRFQDVKAKSVTVKPTSLRALAKEITATHGASKGSLPLLKLARFGNSRTDSASLRHDANLLSVTGIEGDYDAGQVSPEDAADLLRKAGVAALIYTTPSNSPAAPRWRVLAPLASEVSPAERDDLCARLNGALGGILEAESFTRSQAYYMGQVTGADPLQTILVDGQPIDKLPRIRGVWPPHSTRKPKREIPADGDAEPFTDADLMTDADWSRIRSALAAIEDASERDTWREIGMALHSASGGDEQGFNLWCEWSRQCPEKFNERDQRRTWRSFKRSGISIASLFRHARDAGWQESADDLDHDDDMQAAAAETQSPLFLPASRWAGTSAPEREWLVRGFIPHRVVTLLSGDGGTGKSLLALQLAVATGTGTPWLGKEIERPGKALFLSAEDDDDELHRRLEDICGGDLSGLNNVHIKSVVDEDPLLASFDKQNKIQMTTLYKRIADAVANMRPTLLILDTLANLHSGNENDKAHAMQFVNKLKVLATKYRCAVVLLAHPSLSGMANGSGSGGSVGWTNNVRSRLYLSRIQNAEGVELDTNERVLTTTKANYGAKDSKIEMLWQGGRFVAFGEDLDDFGEVAETREERAERVFMTLLDRYTREGSFVSRNTGHSYAPKIFAEQPDCERCSRDDFRAAMNRLFVRQVIENGQHNTKGKAISHIQRAPTRCDTHINGEI